MVYIFDYFKDWPILVTMRWDTFAFFSLHYVCIHHRNETTYIIMLAPFLRYLYCEPHRQPQHVLLRHNLLTMILPIQRGSRSVHQTKDQEKISPVSESLLLCLCQLVPHMQVTHGSFLVYWPNTKMVNTSLHSILLWTHRNIFIHLKVSLLHIWIHWLVLTLCGSCFWAQSGKLFRFSTCTYSAWLDSTEFFSSHVK